MSTASDEQDPLAGHEQVEKLEQEVARLRESEERLRVLCERAPDAAYMCDLKGTFVDGNAAAEALSGYARAELIGKSFLKLRLLSATDLVKAASLLAKSALGLSTGPDEFTLCRKDGSTISVEIETCPVTIGGRRLVLANARDISARRRAQEAVEESEERFRALSDNALAGVYIIQDGRLTYVNQSLARIFGYEPGELIGASPLKLIHADDHALVTENIRRRLEGEVKSLRYEFRGLCKSGEERAIEVYGAAAQLNGRPAIVGNILDITERKGIEEALQQNESRFRAFVEQAPVAIGVFDSGGRGMFANRAFLDTLGLADLEDMVGRPAFEYFARQFQEESRERVRLRRQGLPVPAEYESVALRPDGTEFPVHLAVASIQLSDQAASIAFLTDITERRRVEDLLKRREQDAVRTAAQLQLVMDLSARISEGLGLDRVIQTVYDQCRTLMPIDTFYVALHDDVQGVATFPFYYKDGSRREIPPRDVRASPGLVAHVIAGRQTVYLPDAPASSLPLVHQPGSLSRSIVAVPLLLHRQVTGVFSAQCAEPSAYTEEQINILERLATGIAVAIENSRLYDAVRQGLEATLAALGRAAESRDPYTAGHQLRVTDLALAIANKLGFAVDARHTLRIAGMLHDIGKLGIPAEILSKPSTLSPIELALIQTHPQKAHEILTGIVFPGPVAQIVLQHHERLDGSGYPNGISADDILPLARVLAVADVVEAMAAHRPYRPALGITAALDEIRSGRGTRYDESVVDACVALFESGAFAFDTSAHR